MSTNAGDTYKFETSKQSMRERTPYSKREVIFSQDTNSGAYTNQVQFDLSQFANQTSGLIDISNGVLSIPVVITATAPDNAGANSAPASLDGLLALKNGGWNLINQVSISIDGHELVTPSSLYNGYVSYRMLTSMSADDLKNWGDGHLFTGADEVRSWIYNDTEATTITAANPSRIINGNGLCNNSQFVKNSYLPLSTLANNKGYFGLGNSSFARRVNLINDKPDDIFPINTLATPIPDIRQSIGALRSKASYQDELKNFTQTTGVTTGDGFVQQWYVMVNIKLAFLSDLFQNMPLTRGLYVKMNLVLNTGNIILNLPNVGANSAPAIFCRASDINFSNFNPLQITERSVNPASSIPVNMAGERYLISVGVVRPPNTSVSGFKSHSSLTGITPHSLSSCRITLPVVHAKPDELISYLDSTKEVRVEYIDVYQTTINNVPANQQFNSLISNGSKDIIGVLVVPTIAAQSNGRLKNLVNAGLGPTLSAESASAIGFSTNLSPFVSEMVTPCPISQFQVFFGGEAMFPRELNYGWESYMYHFQDFNRLNGNTSLGIGSGLISQFEWESYYRYYFCNLSRKFEEDTMHKSLNISGKNASNVACDYVVYVLSKKSILVNTSTGRVSK